VKVSAHALSHDDENPRSDTPSGSAYKTKVKFKTAAVSCAICGAGCCSPEQCHKFQAMAAPKRVEAATDKHLCYLCLKPNHRSTYCKSSKFCKEEGCSRRHHTLLHNGWPQQQPQVQVNTAHAKHLNTAAGAVLLQTIPVLISGPSGEKEVNALLDLGSQATILNEDTAAELGLNGNSTSVQLGTIDAPSTRQMGRVQFQLRPMDSDRLEGSSDHTIRALTMAGLNIRPPQTAWLADRDKWPHLSGLEFPEPISNHRTELLLGADYFTLIVPRQVVEGPQGAPSAVRTALGWTVSGRHYPKTEVNSYYVGHIQDQADMDLEKMVRDFWRTESFGTKYDAPPRMSREDERAMQIMESTTRWTGQSYETGLLWKANDIKLPESKAAAMKRLISLERRLLKTGHHQAYAEALQTLVKKGYCRKLSPEEASQPHDREWLLPHHPVIKPGKIRPVFDGRARSRGTSLNENLLTGPDQLNSLIGVLMRFRQSSVAMTSDITDMFMRVGVRGTTLTSTTS